jgi:hypothetical protein
MLTVSIVTLLAAGCSQTPTRAISGQLDVTQFHLAGAQVVAMSSSGRVFRAAVSPTGAFRIVLPTHSTYTLRFANTTSSARLFDAFAQLAPAKAGGARTHWITLTEGPAINLGKIGKVGTVGPVATLRSEGSDDGAETEDGEEDDGAESCDLSSGSDMEDVESEHDALDDVDSDHDGVADSSDSSDDRDACSSASDDGDDCRLTDGQEHDDDSEHDNACSGSGTGGGPAPVPGIG